MGASVKIMLSYDYCHFEVCKSTDENISDKEINELRKDCQRLADEAVKQYKIAKKKAELRENDGYKKERFQRILKNALEKTTEDRSPEEMAIVKQAEDENWEAQFDKNNYDYEDDQDSYDF
jgi:hypothetical protein